MYIISVYSKWAIYLENYSFNKTVCKEKIVKQVSRRKTASICYCLYNCFFILRVRVCFEILPPHDHIRPTVALDRTFTRSIPIREHLDNNWERLDHSPGNKIHTKIKP